MKKRAYRQDVVERASIWLTNIIGKSIHTIDLVADLKKEVEQLREWLWYLVCENPHPDEEELVMVQKMELHLLHAGLWSKRKLEQHSVEARLLKGDKDAGSNDN
jgi:hypothetical protein